MTTTPLRVLRGLLSLLAVASLCPQAFAQGHPRFVEELDPPFTEDPVSTWASEDVAANSPFHRNRFGDRYADDIAAGRVLQVASDLVRLFSEATWDENEAAHATVRRNLDAFLADLAIALSAPGIEGPLDTLEEQSVFFEAFAATGRGVETLAMGTFGPDQIPGFFVVDDRPQDAFLFYELVEESEADGTEEGYLVPVMVGHMRDLRLLMNALGNLIEEQIGQIRTQNVKDLERAMRRWDNYLDKGFSQYPWESLINGYLIGTPDLGPPDRQFIVMHPTLGIEVATDEIDEARVKEALNVEVFGHLWYRGEELENYFGASFAVSFREDIDPGLGVLLHIQRNWNLGITWHDVDEDPFLFFSVDLFRFANAKRDQYKGELDRLRDRIRDLR